ncbi:hypothetical protein SAMN04490178_108138 [Propionispora vibrioides]|uniref:Uncharacterized protein n=2 Tax=Propionispora vibrioides TaxID=112903 RepID=A0A1H8UDG7_9FIRM|nr:hypothetical protein SAMN04490178_108138 [Propionispora vibrioides]
MLGETLLWWLTEAVEWIGGVSSMLQLELEYLFNLIFFAISIFLGLWLMEKVGKKRPGIWQDRARLAVVLAAGATLLHLVVRAAVALAYMVGLPAKL